MAWYASSVADAHDRGALGRATSPTWPGLGGALSAPAREPSGYHIARARNRPTMIAMASSSPSLTRSLGAVSMRAP